MLPGIRWAYDKGGDPFELVLSSRWEEWKEQTRRHFARFDLSVLPVGPGRPLESSETVYIAANNPAWQRIADRCRALGRPVGTSGNTGFDQWLSRARGKTLIVTAVGGHTVLPTSMQEVYFAGGLEADLASHAREAALIELRKLDDGTLVVLLAAQDEAGLNGLIDRLELGGDDGDE